MALPSGALNMMSLAWQNRFEDGDLDASKSTLRSLLQAALDSGDVVLASKLAEKDSAVHMYSEEQQRLRDELQDLRTLALELVDAEDGLIEADRIGENHWAATAAKNAAWAKLRQALKEPDA